MKHVYFLSFLLLSGYASASDSSMILLKDDKNFMVLEDNGDIEYPEISFRRVPNFMVDKSIREVPGEKLAQAVARGSVYIQLHKTNDGEYAVHALPTGLGGGKQGAAIGAAAGEMVGYAVVKFGGELALRGTWRFICRFRGAEAGQEFGDKMIDRLLPGVERVATIVGHAAGIIGAGIGGAVSTE